MSVETIIEHLENQIEHLKNGNFKEATNEQLTALNRRFTNLSVYGDVYYNDNELLIASDTRRWDYYAGLEYVDSEAREEIGIATIFDGNCCERIREIIELLEEKG